MTPLVRSRVTWAGLLLAALCALAVGSGSSCSFHVQSVDAALLKGDGDKQRRTAQDQIALAEAKLKEGMSESDVRRLLELGGAKPADAERAVLLARKPKPEADGK